MALNSGVTSDTCNGVATPSARSDVGAVGLRLSISKEADTVRFAVILVSVLGFAVELSLQDVK